MLKYRHVPLNWGGYSLSSLSSETISAIRLPLTIMVVFIHSFGTPSEVDTITIDYLHLSMFDVYYLIRVSISHVITHCAVPTFFLISGYLFFTKLQEWDWNMWAAKLKSRSHTILIPYFVWCSISIAYTLLRMVAGCIIKDNPWSGITQWMNDNGWLHLYWDSYIWNLDRTNILGWLVPSSSPCLVPFWFMRDMIIVIAFTPIIYWGIKRLNFGFIVTLLVCYVFNVWIPIPGFSPLAALYFSIGAYLIIKGKDLVVTCGRFRYIFYLTAIILFPFMVYYDGHNTEIGDSIYPFFVLSMCGSVINIVSQLERINKMNWSKRYSNTTFFIFASHVFFLPYISKILHKALTFWGPVGDIFAYIIIPIITVIVCIVLCKILQRFFPKCAKMMGCR